MEGLSSYNIVLRMFEESSPCTIQLVSQQQRWKLDMPGDHRMVTNVTSTPWDASDASWNHTWNSASA